LNESLIERYAYMHKYRKRYFALCVKFMKNVINLLQTHTHTHTHTHIYIYIYIFVAVNGYLI